MLLVLIVIAILLVGFATSALAGKSDVGQASPAATSIPLDHLLWTALRHGIALKMEVDTDGFPTITRSDFIGVYATMSDAEITNLTEAFPGLKERGYDLKLLSMALQPNMGWMLAALEPLARTFERRVAFEAGRGVYYSDQELTNAFAAYVMANGGVELVANDPHLSSALTASLLTSGYTLSPNSDSTTMEQGSGDCGSGKKGRCDGASPAPGQTCCCNEPVYEDPNDIRLPTGCGSKEAKNCTSCDDPNPSTNVVGAFGNLVMAPW